MPGRNYGMERAREQYDPGYNGYNGGNPNNNGYNGLQMNYQQNFPQLQYEQSGYVQNRPPAGKFDGPPDNSARGRGGGPPSQRGAPSPSQGLGPPQQQQPQNPFGHGMGFDPARSSRPVESANRVITNTRVELPASAYALETGEKFKSPLPIRPGYNTQGKVIAIRVNQYKVTNAPNVDVYQYDVNIGDGAEKRGKIKAVWLSNAVQNELRRAHNGPWLWDGNKIAWCSANIPEMRIMVDFDKQRGRTPRPGAKPDQCYCIIKSTKHVRLAAIEGYLKKQIPFDNAVLEGINFLDHCIRQYPSEQYKTVKRSFFSKGNAQVSLDNVIIAQKGVYSSIRLCDPNTSQGPGTGLAVNVDVANGTFWAAQDVHQAARNFCKDRNRNLDYGVMIRQLKPVQSANGFTMSADFKDLRKFGKLKFYAKYRGKNHVDKMKEYTIKRFAFDPKYGADGGNAKNVKFDWRQNSQVRNISVYDFFKEHYQITIQYWQLPLIETERDGFFPMELCTIVPQQPYKYKLSPDQTAAMIKFAVTRPDARIESINHGIGMLKWHQDPYLKFWGIKIDPNMTTTNARLLQNPEISFAGSKINPGTQGRWDLRGKKFLAPNSEPLKSWGVIVVGGQNTIDEPTVRNFLNVFMGVYSGHGGKIQNRSPYIYNITPGMDLGEGVMKGRQEIGNQTMSMPQIILCILPGRDSFVYERLKKSMECRFALFSQMMNVAHVRKAQPQYCSNVCMKLNAKLGGTTSKIVSGSNPNASPFPRPTMIIGVDVSHASPGSLQASMAALTMSFDTLGCRYAASVQTNGHRVEMITKENLHGMLGFLFPEWIKSVGKGQLPQHIYYFRDGVSEGQYGHVLDQEIENIKGFLVEKYPQAAPNIRFTVTVCSKRHHIRFFPKKGDPIAADRNNNALPGTLVERDVTHPFEYDFYLCSHSAIQGTARPVHYHVLKDEAQINPNEFQAMIYKHCYQYMRSTTPVSLFPAVYYAHLASNRARAHEGSPASSGPRGGQKFEEAEQDANQRRIVQGRSTAGGSSRSGDNTSEARPLLPMGEINSNDRDRVVKIRTGMWYI